MSKATSSRYFSAIEHYSIRTKKSYQCRSVDRWTLFLLLFLLIIVFAARRIIVCVLRYYGHDIRVHVGGDNMYSFCYLSYLKSYQRQEAIFSESVISIEHISICLFRPAFWRSEVFTGWLR